MCGNGRAECEREHDKSESVLCHLSDTRSVESESLAFTNAFAVELDSEIDSYTSSPVRLVPEILGNMTRKPITPLRVDPRSAGFPPIAGPDARVLILGSLPGRASIEAGEYYAHPRNAFWPIMRDLVGAEGRYVDRCECLVRHGIAVWDVLASSVRHGSLDAAIRTETALCNDFGGFFRAHAGLVLVCFNGRRSEQLYRRLVHLPGHGPALRFASLPSTSPAYASLPFTEKLARWHGIIGPQLAGGPST